MIKLTEEDAQKQLLKELENARKMNPICPYCKDDMVKAVIQTDEGDWYVAWLCACKPSL